MDNNLDNILSSIKQLSTGDKLKIFYLLQEEQKKEPTEEEIVDFVTDRTKELDKCSKEIKEALLESRRFISN